MISSNKKYAAAGIAAKFKKLVLLGRRASICHNFSGHWSIPCGMIELNETPKQAALREFFEETGYKINRELNFVGDFEIADSKYFAIFSMELNDLIFPSTEALDAIEHDEWGFFKIQKNSLPSPMTKDIQKHILRLK